MSQKRRRESYDDDDDEDAATDGMVPINGHAQQPDLYPHSSQAEDDPSGQEMYLSQTDNYMNPNTPMKAGYDGEEERGPQLKHPKSVQDRVHGQILLHGLLVAVMDTVEFQRLDRVKQLGGCAYVYPSATHSRKEHSIGVAHLAGMMVMHLAKHQPELNIDDADVRCVELAGLVHDLGHGPFSHMFETFMGQIMGERKAAAEAKLAAAVKAASEAAEADRAAAEAELEAAKAEAEAASRTWEHEEMSGELLRLLIKENGIPVADYFDCSEHEADQHINFVVRLIEGLKDSEPMPTDIQRGPEKRFLFDIVSNKRSGIDVDKLDYLVRDSMAAFGTQNPPGFDIYRIIKSCKVCYRDKRRLEPEVVYQMKNALEILEVYSLRAKLHRQVYQHRIANVAEAMITDVFLEANSHFRMRGASSGSPPVRLDEAAHDVRTFVRLNDAIIDAIDLYQPQDEAQAAGLKNAWHLLQRLKKRDFYQQVGEQINIETLPLCGNKNCRRGTPIESKFCPHCGQSTALRKGGGHSKEGWLQAEGMLITEDDAREGILSFVSPHIREELVKHNALLIRIVDIQNGKAKPKTDPHKYKWFTYDPLAGVGFFNPKQGLAGGGHDEIERLDQSKMPKIYMPAASHTKTLWCYLRVEGHDVECLHGDEWRAELDRALKKWKDHQRLTAQVGTSNVASPAVHMKGSQPTPKHVPSAAKRSSGLTPIGLDGPRGRLSAVPEGGTAANGGASAAGGQ